MIDTTLLIDVLREDPIAIAALDDAALQHRPVCPDVVLAELLAGCRSRAEMRKVKSFVHDVLDVEIHERADAHLALELLESYFPSHNLGYHDCLIAAMALNRNSVLVSGNLKHFAAVRGLKVRKPY